MFKTSFVILAAAAVILLVFSACRGAESGKVSDTSHDDPVLTELEEMVTEAVSDAQDMLTDAQDSFTDGADDTSEATHGITDNSTEE